MARKSRIEYPGAVSHARARGNQERQIYDDDSDRREWLETLAEAYAKPGSLHSYLRTY